MKRLSALLSPTLLLTITTAAVLVPPPPGTAPANDFGRKTFARLKALAGEWVAVEDGKTTGTVVSRMRVTAGGHAVLEILFPGTEKEMVTVYHLDGDDLVLQHYCVLGNQPRMRARPGKNADEVAFDFASCCNLDDAGDRHMHEATIQFVSDDRLRTAWRQFEQGENIYTVGFDLARKNGK